MLDEFGACSLWSLCQVPQRDDSDESSVKFSFELNRIGGGSRGIGLGSMSNSYSSCVLAPQLPLSAVHPDRMLRKLTVFPSLSLAWAYLHSRF
mmetsp:Transcript_120783/g.352802  ORF Transcript_120783/g.352802 Transcript_120783/m.352802 type:complete len:93 (-) Transcript_120783:23-301(-)